MVELAFAFLTTDVGFPVALALVSGLSLGTFLLALLNIAAPARYIPVRVRLNEMDIRAATKTCATLLNKSRAVHRQLQGREDFRHSLDFIKDHSFRKVSDESHRVRLRSCSGNVVETDCSNTRRSRLPASPQRHRVGIPTGRTWSCHTSVARGPEQRGSLPAPPGGGVRGNGDRDQLPASYKYNL